MARVRYRRSGVRDFGSASEIGVRPLLSLRRGPGKLRRAVPLPLAGRVARRAGWGASRRLRSTSLVCSSWHSTAPFLSPHRSLFCTPPLAPPRQGEGNTVTVPHRHARPPCRGSCVFAAMVMDDRDRVRQRRGPGKLRCAVPLPLAGRVARRAGWGVSRRLRGTPLVCSSCRPSFLEVTPPLAPPRQGEGNIVTVPPCHAWPPCRASKTAAAAALAPNRARCAWIAGTRPARTAPCRCGAGAGG